MDNLINNFWSYLNWIDSNYKIIPGAIVSVFLVFFIEWLRRPKIVVKFINQPSFFNIYQSDKWHIEIEYKESIINKFLFKYSLNNLKVFATFFDKDWKQCVAFQCKPDRNSNVYEEKDVPNALSVVQLSRGEKENFPILLLPKIWQLSLCNQECRWLVFDVWSVFLPNYRGTGIINWCLEDNLYYLLISIRSDQVIKNEWFKIILSRDGNVESTKFNLFNHLNRMFHQ